MKTRSQEVHKDKMETHIAGKLEGNSKLQEFVNSIKKIAERFASVKESTFKVNDYQVLLAAQLLA